MNTLRHIIQVAGASAKFLLWLLTVVIIALLLAYFEVTGLAKVLPPTIAVALSFVVMVVLGVSSHCAWRTRARVPTCLALGLLVVTALEYGVSFGEHLKHEGGQRARELGARSEVTAIEEEWATAKTGLESQLAGVDSLAAEIAGLESLVERGAGIEAEIESLTGRIYAVNNDGKPESEADRRDILAMENRIASLRDEKSRTALPTPEELAGKRALLSTKRERVTRAESELAALSSRRLETKAQSYKIEGGQHAFLSISNRIAQGDRDIASLILIGAGSLVGLIVQGGFCWLCTLGGVARDSGAVSADTGNPGGGEATGDDGEEEIELADNIIAPQFRYAIPAGPAISGKPLPKSARTPRSVPISARTTGRGEPLPVTAEEVLTLSADEVRRLSRKLNRERQFDRHYTCVELDSIPIPERRQMCLEVLAAHSLLAA